MASLKTAGGYLNLQRKCNKRVTAMGDGDVRWRWSSETCQDRGREVLLRRSVVGDRHVDPGQRSPRGGKINMLNEEY
jgi:hypothetical protein